MSIVLALLSSVLWGSADYLGGVAARRITALVVTFLSQLFGLLTLTVLLLLTGGELGGEGAAWGAVAGVVGAATLAIFYAALAAGAMSLVAPLSAVGGVVPVGVALAGGDSPGRLALAGMVVALAGIVLIAGREDAALRLTPRVLLLAAAAALGIGTTLTLLQQGADAPGSSGLAVVAAARVASVAATGLALLIARTVPRPGSGGLAPVAAMGAADSGANALFAVASESGSHALVAVLGSLYPVMTLVLARTLLGERLSARQAAGAALALGGAALVSTG
ncbi:MAG TPA: EamA family transporter [Solirubrobacteraceae bacterium]